MVANYQIRRSSKAPATARLRHLRPVPARDLHPRRVAPSTSGRRDFGSCFAQISTLTLFPASLIYRAFVEGELEVPEHLARRVHELYFNPQVKKFAARTTWSLSSAFTSAFKELDPIPQFRATAKLASFIELAAAVAN